MIILALGGDVTTLAALRTGALAQRPVLATVEAGARPAGSTVGAALAARVRWRSGRRRPGGGGRP